jgi:hypothetical protein
VAALQYSLTWGKDNTDDKIAAAAREEGYATPETIQDQPRVELYDQIYWDCFNDLCGTRPVGQTVGWIPWTAINDWAKRNGIDDPDEFEVLKKLVVQMDVAWIEHFTTNRGTT